MTGPPVGPATGTIAGAGLPQLNAKQPLET